MGLIFTLIIFAILIFGIIKKVDLKCLLIGNTTLVLLYLTIMNGSVLGENTTGNAIVDIFAYFTRHLASNIGGIALTVVIVFAYVEILNKIKATDVVAYMITKWLSKIKSPYVMAMFVIVVGAILRMFISAGPALGAMMIATFVPVLLANKCSKETAAVSTLAFGMITFGPADPNALTAAQVMGIEINPTQWFVDVQIPIVIVMLVTALIMFVITSKIFDKKVEKNDGQSKEVHLTEKPDVPGIYALCVPLPMILMLIFSPYVIDWIIIDVNVACIISMVITMIIMLLANKGKVSIMSIFQVFFQAIGENFKGLGLMIIFATCFAGSLNAVGGLNTIATFLMDLNMPSVLLVLALCIFVAVVTVVVGSFMGSLSIGVSLAAPVAAASGLDPSVLCFVILSAVLAGCMCSPVNPVVLVTSEKCGVSTGVLFKRLAPIMSVVIVVTVIFVCAFF